MSPLPEQHSAAALWWRLDGLGPAVTHQPDNPFDPELATPQYLGPTPATLRAERLGPPAGLEPVLDDPDDEADRVLVIEALVRRTMGPPEPDAAEMRRLLDRADAWRACR